MKQSKKKIGDIIYDIYKELYNNSEPKADFDELIKNATLSEDGIKIIDYMSYEIDEQIMDNIIDLFCSVNKLSENDISYIKMNILLGAAPKSKKNIKDEDE